MGGGIAMAGDSGARMGWGPDVAAAERAHECRATLQRGATRRLSKPKRTDPAGDSYSRADCRCQVAAPRLPSPPNPVALRVDLTLLGTLASRGLEEPLDTPFTTAWATAWAVLQPETVLRRL